MKKQQLSTRILHSVHFASLPLLLLSLSGVLSLFTGCSVFQGRPAGELELKSDLDVCLDLPKISMGSQIALLPVENLSNKKPDLDAFYLAFHRHLVGQGVRLLDEASLQGFMQNNRVRYTGGLSAAASKALLDETGAELFLITSLEAYKEITPPKIAFLARLVTAGEHPRVIWMDSVALAGDDAPGFLGLGEVKEIGVLSERALAQMTRSLVSFISGIVTFSEASGSGLSNSKTSANCPSVNPMTLFEHSSAPVRYAPKTYYHSPIFDPRGHYTVALIEPLNNSDRNHAGSLLMLHLLNQLLRNEHFTVVEPGLVREQFLNYRLVMESGVSLSTSDIIFSTSPVRLDLVLSGIVFDYQDDAGLPKVDFSLVIVEKNSREIVWDSKSDNQGDDWVFFFDAGQVRSASELVQRMVSRTIKQMTD